MVNELIRNGEFKDALSHLTDINDENTRYLRLVCLIGLKEYRQARAEGAWAKENAQDTYYDVVSMYVTALKELGDFEEAIRILIEELSMPYIPYEYEIMFNTAYDEVLLEKQEAQYQVESKNQIFSIEEIAQILKNKECNEDLMYMALDQLQQLNIRMILNVVRDYLLDPSKHFFAKTLLLEILIDQQVDEELEVEKLGQYYSVNPYYMPLVLSQDVYQGTVKYLQNYLEDDNPSLYEQCVEFLEFALYALYPREIYEDEYNILAGSLHYYIASLQNIEITIEDIEVMYYCDESEIHQYINLLKKIEII